MANERTFAKRRADELMEDATLRRRAVGLVLIGAGFIIVGIATSDVFSMTVGLISVGAGGAWRLWLAIPNP